MRDFPVFTTENGVGTLVLKEIPYNATAYVTVRDSSFPTEFLQECLEFCRVAGAQTVYASGNRILEAYPLHTAVIKMSASWEAIPHTDACLFPVTKDTLQRFREIYNERMSGVDLSAFMSERAAQQMLERGDGYFIHTNGKLLGIGMVSDDHIDCVAAVEPGGGRDVVCALVQALICDRVILEVASTNLRAIRLYESLGFVKTAEVSRWYKIF